MDFGMDEGEPFLANSSSSEFFLERSGRPNNHRCSPITKDKENISSSTNQRNSEDILSSRLKSSFGNENRTLERRKKNRTRSQTLRDGAGDIIDETLLALDATAILLRKAQDEEAAIYLEEGLENFSLENHPKSQDERERFRLAHNKFVYSIDLIGSYLLLLLAFFEYDNLEIRGVFPTKDVYRMHDGEVIISWHRNPFAIFTIAILEITAIIMVSVETYAMYKFLGREKFLRNVHYLSKSTITILYFAAAVHQAVDMRNPPLVLRLLRAFRPYFICTNHYSQDVRRVIREILRSLPAVLDMVILLLFYIFACSVVFYYLWFIPDPAGSSCGMICGKMFSNNNGDYDCSDYNFCKGGKSYNYKCNDGVPKNFSCDNQIPPGSFASCFCDTGKGEIVTTDCKQFMPENPFFSSLWRSFISMFVLLTTANYPDVMMQAYSQNGLNFFYFFAYLFIGLYLLMNVVLSVVYEKYTSNEKQKFEKLYKMKRRCVRRAYNLLYNQQHGGVIAHRFLGMMKYYYKTRGFKHSRLIFSAMCGNNNHVMSIDQFQQFYQVSEFYFTRDIEKYGEIDEELETGTLGNFQIIIARVVSKRSFRVFYDTVVVINTLLISVNACYLTPEDKITPPPVDIMFLVLYWLEALLMIIGLGWVSYWSRGWNKFDLSITLLSTFALAYSENMLSGQFFAALRALRVARLFKIKRRFRQVLGAMFSLLPKLMSFVYTIVYVFYWFAIIGMALFAGEFKKDSNGDILRYESLVKQGCCTSPDTQDNYFSGNLTDNPVNTYYYNNFNNIYYSYVTLFELMVVNNWFVIMDGHVASHGPLRELNKIDIFCTKSLKNEFMTVSLWWLPKSNTTASCNSADCYDETCYSLDDEFIRLYFLTFYIVVVILVSNVVVAFILEAFMTRMAAEDDGLDSADLDFEKIKVGIHRIIDSRYNNESQNKQMSRFGNGTSEDSDLVFYVGYRTRTLEDMRMLMYKEDLPLWNFEAENSARGLPSGSIPQGSPSASEQKDTNINVFPLESTMASKTDNTNVRPYKSLLKEKNDLKSMQQCVKDMGLEDLQILSDLVQQEIRLAQLDTDGEGRRHDDLKIDTDQSTEYV